VVLPRFCWQEVAIVISQAVERIPQIQFIVLCGHTHSDSIWKQGNIKCHTAGSAYGRIDHSGMINFVETVSAPESDPNQFRRRITEFK
jgi:hypothetical protein